MRYSRYVLTFWGEDRAVGLYVGETAARLAASGAAGKNLVDAAIFRLQVLDFHYVLQAVDGAAKVDFPHSGIGFVPVLARMYCPFAKQSGVSLLAVAALLRMDPRDAKHGLFIIDPLQTVKSS